MLLQKSFPAQKAAYGRSEQHAAPEGPAHVLSPVDSWVRSCTFFASAIESMMQLLDIAMTGTASDMAIPETWRVLRVLIFVRVAG